MHFIVILRPQFTTGFDNLRWYKTNRGPFRFGTNDISSQYIISMPMALIRNMDINSTTMPLPKLMYQPMLIIMQILVNEYLFWWILWRWHYLPGNLSFIQWQSITIAILLAYFRYICGYQAPFFDEARQSHIKIHLEVILSAYAY